MIAEFERKYRGRVLSGKEFNNLTEGIKFYKILPESMRRNGMNYKNGLNTDIHEFYPYGECNRGGIYFTNQDEIPYYMIPDFGTKICEIIVPEWTIVYVESRKYKAHQIIIQGIKNIEDLELWNDENKCIEAITKNPFVLRYIRNQTNKICLAAVTQNGLALEFVQEKTIEIILAAVTQNGLALQFVQEKTNKIVLAAMKQNIESFKFVTNQTDNICSIAAKSVWYMAAYVLNTTLTGEAFNKTRYAISYYSYEYSPVFLNNEYQERRLIRNLSF